MICNAPMPGADRPMPLFRGSIGSREEQKIEIRTEHPLESAVGYAVANPRKREMADREDVSGIIRLHKIENDLPSDVLQKVFRDLKAKDRAIYTHGQRVALYAMMIGERFGMSEERLFTLGVAAWLHDIGKLHVPKAILNKDGRLTRSEWDVMRRHADFGHQVLSSMGAEGYARVAFGHHERHDGKGYHGISAHRLDAETQITSVADTYDAVTSRRCYRDGASHEHAMTELVTCAGSQFSPNVVDIAVGLEADLNRIRSWAWQEKGANANEPDLSLRIGMMLAV